MAKRDLADSVKDPVKKFLKEGEDRGKGISRKPGEPLVNFNTKLPESLTIDVKVHCAKNRLKIQDFVLEALRDRLKAAK